MLTANKKEGAKSIKAMIMKNLITEKIKELRVNYNVFKNVGNTEMLNIVAAKINVLQEILDEAQLLLHNVVGQSEQLVCSNCKTRDMITNDGKQCIRCGTTQAN